MNSMSSSHVISMKLFFLLFMKLPDSSTERFHQENSGEKVESLNPSPSKSHIFQCKDQIKASSLSCTFRINLHSSEKRKTRTCERYASSRTCQRHTCCPRLSFISCQWSCSSSPLLFIPRAIQPTISLRFMLRRL